MALRTASPALDGVELHVVCNPAAGSRTSRDLLDRRVLPSLKRSISVEAVVHLTDSEGDGVRIGREIAASAARRGSRRSAIVLLGGDGTTNEVLNGLVASAKASTRFSIALVPTGTANALYAALYPPSADSKTDGADDDAWRLRSLDALIAGLPAAESDKLSPLTLFKIFVQGRDAETKTAATTTTTTFGHLVVSHALHASILADSEALRTEMPGVERFKVAAERNSINWVRGSLLLLPFTAQRKGAEAKVQRYDSRRGGFVDVASSKHQLEGPFVYLTAMVTDRLERDFVPAPFSAPRAPRSDSSKDLQRPAGALDIVVIRPLRDPCVGKALASSSRAEEQWPLETRIDFARHRLAQITKGMYDEGSHVKLRYATKEAPSEKDAWQPLVEDGEGEEAEEYYRIGGYEWLPEKDDDKAALTCVDGAIYKGSRTLVTATAGSTEGRDEAEDAPKIGAWH